jgi:Rieske Fe-S protein
MMQINFRIVILFSIVLLIASCKKDKSSNVQGGYVDAQIYLNDPSAVQLNSIGGWIYFNNGSSGLKGLIIFRRSQEDFSAYDRACTYHTTESCALVEVESNNAFGVDSCCGSRFNLYSLGIVEKGPATQPLISYRTSFDGSVLRVTN